MLSKTKKSINSQYGSEAGIAQSGIKHRLSELEEAIALKREIGMDEYFSDNYCRGCGGCCYNVAPWMGEEELERLAMLSPNNADFEVAVRLCHHGSPREIKSLCKSYGMEYNKNQQMFFISSPDVVLIQEPYAGNHKGRFLFYILQKEGGACQLLDTDTHLCTAEKGKPEICRRAGCREMKVDIPLLTQAGKFERGDLTALAAKHGKRQALRAVQNMCQKYIKGSNKL